MLPLHSLSPAPDPLRLTYHAVTPHVPEKHTSTSHYNKKLTLHANRKPAPRCRKNSTSLSNKSITFRPEKDKKNASHANKPKRASPAATHCPLPHGSLSPANIQ
ncbi:hypothetical protein E2C01_092017 [Portunus trituberculatus]|uniref:Uncharacterized protein n=1 Tax=Portunus trituberculatus TaxID=210409 RepID=A0A5B7JFG4_PORTR|nr:hypothetical protein [Portunus trituberculatus]